MAWKDTLKNLLSKVGDFLNEQLTWAKGFFEDRPPGPKPSHKNLIAIMLAVVFLVAFMKKVVASATTDPIPDIPETWAFLLGGIIGVRAIVSAYEKMINKKYNGNGDTDSTTTSTQKQNGDV